MLDLASAARIAYPLRDPVVADTAQHYADMDRRDDEAARIAEIVADLKRSDDGYNTVMSEPEMDHHGSLALRIIAGASLDVSKEHAMREFEIAFKIAAHRVAGRMLAAEIRQAEEDAAMAAYERRQERCEGIDNYA